MFVVDPTPEEAELMRLMYGTDDPVEAERQRLKIAIDEAKKDAAQAQTDSERKRAEGRLQFCQQSMTELERQNPR